MGHVLDGILRMPPAVALALVFLLPAIEASIFVGVVVPGEVGVILGGVLANQHKLSLAAVFAAGISGAIIGDSIGYWVGRRYGEALLTRLPDRLVDEKKIQRTKDTIQRLGGKAVFVGRFTAALRAFVPGIAGLGRLRYRKFLLWNVLGGGCWASGFLLLGYLAGSQSLEDQAPPPRGLLEPEVSSEFEHALNVAFGVDGGGEGEGYEKSDHGGGTPTGSG